MATANDVVDIARRTLQDYDADRYSDPELLKHFNGARRALQIARPQAYATEAALTLVSGSRQTLPADCAQLMDMPRNNAGHSVTVFEREFMDLFNPSWRTADPGPTEHFAYDEREPGVVEVYPPAVAGHVNRILYSRVPADVELTYVLSREEDAVREALADYITGRALLEDAESPANKDRGMLHLSLFGQTIGVTLTSLLQNAPNYSNVGGRLPKNSTGR